jgi:hypothetical protein
MIAELTNHVWQSTLLALTAGLLNVWGRAFGEACGELI